MEEQAGLEIISGYFADFTPKQEAQLAALAPLYREWNEKINVISRKDIDQLYTRHVLHSLAIAAVCDFSSGAQVVDIGTGGGFPGIPLAILFPEVSFTLIDSIGKKIRVVEEVANAIGLENVTPIHGRVESLKERRFHFAVSRAVAPLNDLWTWARPLLLPGKMSTDLANGLICLKGGDLTEEIKASGLRPTITALPDIFPEPAFEEKSLVYVRM